MLWKDPVPSDRRSGRDAATQQFMEACRGSCIAIPSLQGLQAPVEEQGLLAANPGVGRLCPRLLAGAEPRCGVALSARPSIVDRVNRNHYPSVIQAAVLLIRRKKAGNSS